MYHISNLSDKLDICQLKYQGIFKDFIDKLKKFTTWKPIYKEKKMYGAVAYLKADQGSARYAEKQGLFVIRAMEVVPVLSTKKILNQKSFLNSRP